MPEPTDTAALSDSSPLSLCRYLIQAGQNFNQRDQLRAAALSFYALLSLFPSLVLIIYAANLFWGVAVVQDQLTRLAQRFFPGDVPAMIISGVESAVNQGQSLNLIALVGLLWAASSFFSNLTVALDTIFEPAPNRHPLWRSRLVAAATIIMLALLLSLTVIVTYSLRAFSQSSLATPSVLMRPVSLLIPLLLYSFVLTLLYRYVPRSRTRWRAIIPGALIGSIGWELSRAVFAWYLENLATYNAVYGSLGAVIALLIWIYLSLALLLVSAEISVALDRWLEAK